MSVDESEVIKHESYKHWWDKTGAVRLLHELNDIRISFIRDGLVRQGILKSSTVTSDPNYLAGIKIIDVGCGAGILCEPLARLGASITGIDPSQELINIAKQHADENANTFKTPPTYIASSIDDHSLKNPNVYDAVVASEVIEHTSKKEVFLDACANILKPGGSIFITTPNRTSLSWLGNIILAEDVLKLVPQGIHEWDKFITPPELKQSLQNTGCDTVFVKGILYNMIKRDWIWYNATIFHYALQAIKRIR